MARPRKKPADKRGKMVNIRLTPGEFEQLKKLADGAGLPYGRYARETILGRRPKARPAQVILFNRLINELNSIATNFQQLANATGDHGYMAWARYTGGQIIEHLIGRDDVSETIEAHLDAINSAGHKVNALARKANSDQPIKAGERTAAIRAVAAALAPVRDALQHNNKKKIPEPPGDV